MRRTEKGTALIIAMVTVMLIAGLVVMLFNGTMAQMVSVDSARSLATSVRAAESMLHVALLKLETDGTTAACLGTGGWTTTDDTNGNGRPDFDEVAGTAPLAFGDARVMTYAEELAGTGTAGDPFKVVVYASAEHDGVVSEFEAVAEVVSAPPEYVLVPSVNWDPSASMVSGGDIEITGNADIEGSGGNVHANGDASVSGSGHVTGNLSAAGTASGASNVDGTTTSGVSKRSVPLVDVEKFRVNHAAEIDYVYKSDGTVEDGAGGSLGTGSYGGMTYNSTTQKWSGTLTGDGTYFFETDVDL